MVFNADGSGTSYSTSYAEIEAEIVIGTMDEYSFSSSCIAEDYSFDFTWELSGNQLSVTDEDGIVITYDDENTLMDADNNALTLDENGNLTTENGTEFIKQENDNVTAAQEAFRLIVDMYVNDSDFRDLLQFYVDDKGEGPTITMGELDSGDPDTELFGLGSVDGTESVIDMTNVLLNPERAQETIAHELMHNLGLGHETEEEETAFDTELGLMFDMDAEGTSRSEGQPWSGYAALDPDGMPYDVIINDDGSITPATEG